MCKPIPRPLSKKSKLRISLYRVSGFEQCFYCMLIWGLSKYISLKWNQAADHLLLLNTKRSWKNKKKSETSFPASFSAWFLKKKYFCCIFCSNFTVWYNSYIKGIIREILRNMYNIVLLNFINFIFVINLKIDLMFLINLGFFACPKSQDKYLNNLRTKRAFRMKLKAFFIIFEGLLLKPIYFFGRWEPDFNWMCTVS